MPASLSSDAEHEATFPPVLTEQDIDNPPATPSRTTRRASVLLGSILAEGKNWILYFWSHISPILSLTEILGERGEKSTQRCCDRESKYPLDRCAGIFSGGSKLIIATKAW